MLYRYIKEEVNKTFSMESGGRSGREREVGGGGGRCLDVWPGLNIDAFCRPNSTDGQWLAI